MTDAALIDRMTAIRARNNDRWMDLLRLALRVAPEETRAIFREIQRADAEVVAVFKELTR